MVAALQRNWWVLLLRGIAIILFGVFAVLFPITAFEVLVIFYGAFALVGGLFAIASAFTGVHPGIPTWALLAEGAAGVVVGLITFFFLPVSVLALLYLIAGWEIVTGIYSIVEAIQLRKFIQGEILLILSGIVSILFGLIIILRPGIGVELVGLLIGLYALFFGIMLVTLSLRVKNWHADGPSPA